MAELSKAFERENPKKNVRRKDAHFMKFNMNETGYFPG